MSFIFILYIFLNLETPFPNTGLLTGAQFPKSVSGN